MTANATKDTNPKDAVGIAKVPISTIPMQVIAEIEMVLGFSVPDFVLAEIGLGMMEGGRKYGRHNYRVAGVRASVYYDANWRHAALFEQGEDIDPDSGLSHITKQIAGLLVLRDSMLQGNWTDDRPPKGAKRKLASGLDAWWEGENVTYDGHSLVTVELGRLVIQRAEMIIGTWVDERAPHIPNPEWLRDLNHKAAALLQKYPVCVPAFTELDYPTSTDTDA